jgi:hypothetical protein
MLLLIIYPQRKFITRLTAAEFDKPVNTLVMGRACFLRVPVSEANDLNFLLCRCHETNYASRLGNNEIQPTKHIEPNRAMKNRAPNNPIKPNLLEQRRTRRWCRCLTWLR